MNCSKCNEIANDSVECGSCRGHYHFHCSGIAEKTYRKMGAEKKASWRCSQCRAPVNTPGNEMQLDPSAGAMAVTNAGTPLSADPNPTTLDIFNEIRALRAEFNAMKLDVKASLSEIESRFVSFEDRLTTTEDKMSKLQQELSIAKETIVNLQNVNDAREQYCRQNNVEISGVPVTNGENLITILQSVYNIVGLQFDNKEIDSIHRVRRFDATSTSSVNNAESSPKSRSRPPAIVVKFIRRTCKDQLLAAVRARRGLTSADIGLPGPASKLYLSDHLTPGNKLLLKRARELKLELNYVYLWVRDCKIFIRKNDKSKVIRINNVYDLSKIK